MSDEVYQIWLQRAKSNLSRAELGRQKEDILYEDLCFDAQQAVEKTLKGLMAYLKIKIPRTHSIGFLLKILSNSKKVDVPRELREAVVLTDYAVTARYPGNWEPLCNQDYRKAVQLARDVFNWAGSIIDRGKTG